MSEWQSIETAPKDGTEILLYYPRYAYSSEAPNEMIVIGRWKFNFRISQSYYSDHSEMDDYGLARREHAPTHWMPLPQPPKERTP